MLPSCGTRPPLAGEAVVIPLYIGVFPARARVWSRETSLRERDIYQGTRGRFRRMDVLRPALGLLVQHGYLREIRQQDARRCGRPSGQTYEVNPHVWTSFEDTGDFEHMEENSKKARQVLQLNQETHQPGASTEIQHQDATPQNPQNPQNSNLDFSREDGGNGK